MVKARWRSLVFNLVLMSAFLLPVLPYIRRAERAPIDLYAEPLPEGAISRLGTTRFRHASQVVDVDFSKDGKLVATGGYDPFVRVWDATSGKAILRIPLQGHPHYGKRRVAFSSDSKLLAAATADVFCVCEVPSGRVRLKHNLPGGERVSELAFQPGGKILALISWRNAGIGPRTESLIRLWDVEKDTEVGPLQPPPGYTRSVAFSPDGRVLALGQKSAVHLCDAGSGKKLRTLPGVRACYSCVAFSATGVLATPGEDDKIVQLWGARTGARQMRLRGHGDVVTSLAFSADGKRLVSAGADATVRVWDLASGRALFVHRGLPLAGVACVALSPDGRTVAAGSQNAVFALLRWDVASGKEVAGPQGQTSAVEFVGWASTGKVITAGRHGGNSVHVWDPANGEPLSVLREPNAINLVALSPDGKIVAVARQDGTVGLRELTTGENKIRLAAKAGFVRALAFAPDGNTLAVGYCYPTTIILWHLASGRKLCQIQQPRTVVDSLAFSPDGEKLVSTSEGLRVWHSATGEALGEIPIRRAHVSGFGVLRFSPDGKLLAAPSYPKGFGVWNMGTKELVGLLDDDGVTVRSVAFSSDGSLLACGKEDGSVVLWRVRTWEVVGKGQGPPGRVYAVHFSPDDRVLISGHEDTTALVWDVARLLATSRRKQGPKR